MSAPSEDELDTLDADLRRARQHRHAEFERMREMQREVEALIERARALLERHDARDDADPR